mgnify:CR=1 FL=1
MNPGFRRHASHILWLFASLPVVLGLAYAYFSLPLVAAGFDYRVFADALRTVSALAFDVNGDLYATLEKRHGQGQLVHMQQGRTREVLGGMDTQLIQ